MINLNKIFDAFDKSNVSKDTDDLSLLVDFSEHPLYWIGYFNKVINNYVFFTQYMTKNIKKTSLDVRFSLLSFNCFLIISCVLLILFSNCLF